MKEKLVIFDFDGVIADSKKLYIEIIHSSLLKNYVIFPRDHVVKSLGPKLEITLKNISKFKPKTIIKLKKDINNWILKKTKSLKICPYVKETLKELKKEEIKIVLLTNSARKYVILFLKINKIYRYFDDIFGSENFNTKEQKIKELAKKYKIKTKKIIYIGDKIRDIKIARNVGCKIIISLACSWDKKILRKRKQKFIIKNLSKLKNAIR